MSINEEFYNTAIKRIKDMNQYNAKVGLDKTIQKAIDFGIEKETPKLQEDEMLSVRVSLIENIGIKIDVLRVKKK